MVDESLFKVDKNFNDLLKKLPDVSSVKFIGVKITSYCDNKTPPELRLLIVQEDDTEQIGSGFITGCPYPPHCKNLLTAEEKSKCLHDYFVSFNMF